ncbi:uncharacterized protein LOC143626397 [Bidens hawaiensis]|uniref:uncharacterized protein LOC143626397 n=1 Tax=Bidens hawaiensis TaxID=980011 RepID=UPI0040490F9E
METLTASSITSTTYTRFNTPNLTNSVSFPSSAYYSTFRTLRTNRRLVIISKSASEDTGITAVEDEWLKNLPDKKKPLYSHSLPCIEAWLKQLGFVQRTDDRAVWVIEKADWHAKLSLDITDLYIRYLKSGPGNLDKDVERRFSYALSREDIENAILGGP